ncbi:MAG TPA: ABC transporter ATP-binding protein [Streptosporangiaceae bacterium]|jgi:ABC-2 type transport system ATP-binding protein|nr:ABC transporter ATP-binding protein [Streptosporangiaceae bacterium]
MNAIETAGLSRRYRRVWALRDCTLAIPAGRVVALVGPNGAGKTTLLNLAVGLTTPTEGTVTVLDGRPAGSAQARSGIAFVAQDAPLYPNLSVADTLHLTRNLNLRWDQKRAASRLAELAIPLDRKVGKLSGGQQAQLALTLAVARLPELVILDEPLARLDPLARHDFMASLMAAVAEDGLSVLFSSHVVAELERVADYLIVLSRGRLQVAGPVDDLVAGHRVLTGPAAETDLFNERLAPLHVQRAGAQAHLMVRMDAAAAIPAGWTSTPVGLEELVLAYLREPDATVLPGPATLNRVAS